MNKIKEAYQVFGNTWKRWLIPVCIGVVAVCSLWNIITLEDWLFKALYFIVLMLAVLVIALYELLRRTNK